MGGNSKLRDAVERKVQTASQSNTYVTKRGTVGGYETAQILFGFRFRSQPVVLLTPMWYSSLPITGIQALLQDAQGYFIGANIYVGLLNPGYYTMVPLITVNWQASGTGIEAEVTT